MKLSRRHLLGAFAAAPFIPAIAAAVPVRAPYVEVGDDVDTVIWHIWEDPRNPAPHGPLAVHEVLPWDGKGYPIVLAQFGWKKEDRKLFTGFYDFEWSMLRRDVPKYFWHDPANAYYPNVHSYVREQRFGEPPAVMRAYMERNRNTMGIHDFTPEQYRAALQPYLENPGHAAYTWAAPVKT